MRGKCYTRCVRRLRLKEIQRMIDIALEEDHVEEDITTLSVISPHLRGEAIIYQKEKGIVGGLPIAEKVFKKLHPPLKVYPLVGEGSYIEDPPKGVLRIEGKLQPILQGERVALNFLGFTSGVATRVYSLKKKYPHINFVDTRKTIPGLRILSKYAIYLGGGINHRIHLEDMGLIKDNHLKAIPIEGAIKKFRKKYPLKKLEIEEESLEDLERIPWESIQYIMLDNFSIEDLKKALSIIQKKTQNLKRKVFVEVSGNIHEKDLEKYPLEGVDYISMGRLTYEVCFLDFSLEIVDVYKRRERRET